MRMSLGDDGLDPGGILEQFRLLDRSQNGTTSVQVRFTNLCCKPVSVRWLDYSGQEIQYTVLQSREQYNVTTFLTHPWVFYNYQTDEKRAVQVAGARVCCFEAHRFLSLNSGLRNTDRARILEGSQLINVPIVPSIYPVHSLRLLVISRVVNLVRNKDDIQELELPDTIKTDIEVLYRRRHRQQ
ncbi:uncharacterized protein LOC111711406 isoform X4 [Eurytemora carolleeae]|uniref:uncharacterized protein LOC111711406 isoform X4 n=1 Tax=Eurytemora carolleeae TaxID=1294199 RepID=UPI000C75D050|nr:uncharacterized protein LOC111711406 isoform X4 [Eurytemora carolleeae]|eukprot:XP_023341524.1 uncharacterized protein LOC111711406 isoform X4 [Eurytemora affinis]